MNPSNLTDARWIKSSFSSNNGACVEMAGLTDGRVAVRDSKHPDGGVLVFTSAAFAAWITEVKHGEFDHLTEG